MSESGKRTRKSSKETRKGPDGPVLRRWAVKNFKSLRDQEFDFAPLTLLAGENSSGKSSVIKSILLLAQASRQQSDDEYVALNGDLVALGKYDEVKSFFSNSELEKVLISASFSASERARGFRGLRASRMHMLGTGEFSFDWSLKLDRGPASRPTAAKVVELSCVAEAFDGRVSEDQEEPTRSTRAKVRVSNEPISPVIEEAARVTSILSPEEPIDQLLLRLQGVQELERKNSDVSDDREEGFSSVDVYGVILRGGLFGTTWKRSDVVVDFVDQALSFLLMRSGSWRSQLLKSLRQDKDEGSTEDQAEIRDPKWQQELENLADVLWVKCLLLLEIVNGDDSKATQLTEASPEGSDDDSQSQAARPVGLLRKAVRSIELEDEIPEALTRLDPQQVSAEITSLLKERASEEGIRVPDTLISSDHALSRSMILTRGRETLEHFFAPVQDLVRLQLDEGLAYLGPLRQDPDIQRRAPVATATRLGAKGESTAATLLARIDDEVFCPAIPGHDHGLAMADAEMLPLGEALKRWLRYLEIARDVSPRDEGLTGIATSVVPMAGGDDRNVDLSAMGVGVSQVLPVLVLCLLTEPGTIILLEQPELHLHPAAQLRLGDFFLGCANSGRQLIVETHSEHLVSRLRSAAAHDPENKAQDLFTIYFGEQDEQSGETKFRHVQPNELGGLSDWPAGFFDQSSTESQEILIAGLRKQGMRDDLSPEVSDHETSAPVAPSSGSGRSAELEEYRSRLSEDRFASLSRWFEALRDEIQRQGLPWSPSFTKQTISFKRQGNYTACGIDVRSKSPHTFFISLPAELGSLRDDSTGEVGASDPLQDLSCEWDPKRRQVRWYVEDGSPPDLADAVLLCARFQPERGSMQRS